MPGILESYLPDVVFITGSHVCLVIACW